MHWTTWLIAGMIILIVFLVKKMSLISTQHARRLLQEGAKVIDVRTVAEYQKEHLPGAVNVPLDAVREQIGREVPNKQHPLLLHCLGGVRSGMARRILRQMGYSSAYNLGSYSRAEKILTDVGPPAGNSPE